MPTRGPHHAVPCPHCGKKIDFSDALDMLDEDAVFVCDHCARRVVILDLLPTTIVTLEKK